MLPTLTFHLPESKLIGKVHDVEETTVPEKTFEKTFVMRRKGTIHKDINNKMK